MTKWGYIFGVQALTFSLINIVPMSQKTVSVDISEVLSTLNLTLMWTAVSLIVFLSWPAKSVIFLLSHHRRSQDHVANIFIVKIFTQSKHF